MAEYMVRMSIGSQPELVLSLAATIALSTIIDREVTRGVAQAEDITEDCVRASVQKLNREIQSFVSTLDAVVSPGLAFIRGTYIKEV